MEQYLFHQIRNIPCNFQTSKVLHSHDFWQIDFIDKGDGCVLIQGKTGVEKLFFKANDSVIIPPNIVHCFDYQNNSSSWLSVKFTTGSTGDIAMVLSDDILRNVAAILIESLSPKRMSCMASMSIVNSVLSVVCNRYSLELQEQNSNISEFVRKVKEFIYAHQGREVRVCDIGEFMDCTPKHVALRFRQETGISLKRFLDETRADFAARLLLTSSKSLNEIARQTEFRDVYAFSRFFKRITGKNLSEYRNSKPYSC